MCLRHNYCIYNIKTLISDELTSLLLLANVNVGNYLTSWFRRSHYIICITALIIKPVIILVKMNGSNLGMDARPQCFTVGKARYFSIGAHLSDQSSPQRTPNSHCWHVFLSKRFPRWAPQSTDEVGYQDRGVVICLAGGPPQTATVRNSKWNV